MKLDEFVDFINNQSENYKARINTGNHVLIQTHKSLVAGLLILLKNKTFKHLAMISAVDFINQGEFELVYNVFSYEYKINAFVKCRIKRENANMESILEIWPHAQRYEQDIHEFFGINFTGNPDLSSLFLHNWLDIPPMRKDFNTREFTETLYGDTRAENVYQKEEA